MKGTLNSLFVILATVLVPFYSVAQEKPYNAYYLAKQLVQLEDQLKATKVDSIAKYQGAIKRIIPYVLGYAELDEFEYNTLLIKLKEYPDLDSVVTRLVGSIDYNALILGAKASSLPSQGVFKSLQSLKGCLDSLQTAFHNFSFKDTENTLWESKLNPLETVQKRERQPGQTTFSVDSLQKDFDSHYTYKLKTYRDELVYKVNGVLDNVLDTGNYKLMKLSTDELIGLPTETKDNDTLWHSFLMDKIENWRDTVSTSIGKDLEKVKTDTLKQLTNEILNIVNKLSVDDKKILINKVYKNLTGKTELLIGEDKSVPDVTTFGQAEALSVPTVAIPNGSIAFKLPSETEMINAMAIYLASRVKQEAVLWFFEQLRNRAKAEELFRTAFPETIRLLMSDEIYEVPNMGTAWRYALSKDFVTMPDNLVESDWFEKRLSANNTAYLQEFLKISLEIKKHLSAKLSYRDMIRQMYIYTVNQPANQQKTIEYGYGLIKLLYAFSNELNQVDRSDPASLEVQGLTFEQLTNMRAREMSVMLSLLDMKYGKPLASLFDNWQAGFDRKKASKFAAWIGQIQINLNQFDNVLKALHAAEKQEGSQATKIEFNYYNVYSLLSNLLSSMTPAFDPPATDKIDLTKVTRGIELIKGMNEVYHLMAEKNYAGGVQQMIGLINYASYNIPLEQAMPDTLAITSEDRYEKMFEDHAALAHIRKFSAFLNDVAEAKGEDQLAKVIKSYTLPAGSYKRKRNAWTSLDINAYVGGFAGFEFTEDLTGFELLGKGKGTYGLSAPIGVSLSWGTRKRKVNARAITKEGRMYRPGSFRQKGENSKYQYLNGNANTLFFSMVDLGTFLSFRFKNDSQVEHEVYWKQFISPGFFFMKGIKGTPLVWTIGGQYVPEFRSVANDMEQKSPYMNTWRLQTALLFDIPLFNLYSKN